MGRPRKTIAELVRAKTYRPSRHLERWLDERACETPCVPPAKPADLKGVAGEMWDELVAHLAGVVAASDGPMLVVLVQWWAELRRCDDAVGRMKVGTAAYLRTLRLSAKCSDRVVSIASRFGLSPADRARVRLDTVTRPAAVMTRPRTKLDRAGNPSGE